MWEYNESRAGVEDEEDRSDDLWFDEWRRGEEG